MSERKLLMKIAIMLFKKEKFTLGQASRFAKMDQLERTNYFCGAFPITLISTLRERRIIKAVITIKGIFHQELTVDR
jgi:hypothetical protein